MGFVVLHMPWEMTGVFWMGLLTLGTVAGCGLFLVRTARKAAHDGALSQARQLDALEAVLAHAKQLGDRSKSLDSVATSYGEEFSAQLAAHAKSHQDATRAVLEPLTRRTGAETVTAMQEHFRKVEHALTEHNQTQQSFLERMDGQLSAAVAERRASDEKMHSQISKHAEVLLSTTASTAGRSLEAVATAAKETQAQVADRAVELLESTKNTADQTLASVASVAKQVEENQRTQLAHHSEALEQVGQTLVERLDCGFSELTGAVDRSIETGRNLDEMQRERVNTQWEEVCERDVARSQELAELCKLVREDLVSSTDEARRALDSERERVMEREVAHGAREETLARQLGQASEELSLAAVAQRETLGTVAEEVRSCLTGIQDALETRGDSLLTTVQGQAEQQLASLEQVAQRMEHKSGHAMGELEQLVQQMSVAMERQRESQSAALEAFRAVDEAVLNAGERAAAGSLEQFLTRTHEVFDQQLELHEELLQRLAQQEAVVLVDDAATLEEEVELLEDELGEALEGEPEPAFAQEEEEGEGEEEAVEADPSSLKDEVVMDVVDVVEEVPVVANAVA